MHDMFNKSVGGMPINGCVCVLENGDLGIHFDRMEDAKAFQEQVNRKRIGDMIDGVLGMNEGEGYWGANFKGKPTGSVKSNCTGNVIQR
jgi:hypothetical protein